MSHNKAPLEIVTWRDAHFYEDEPEEVPSDFLVTTVGWVTEDGKFIRIVSERTPNGDRAITRVPNDMVYTRVVIGGVTKHDWKA